MDFIITKTSSSTIPTNAALPYTTMVAHLASQTTPPSLSTLTSLSNSTNSSKSTITTLDLSPLPTTLLTSLLSNTTSAKDLDAKLLSMIAHDNVPCYNDQGFSVNCATWTGYRYTWPESYGGATALAGTGSEDSGSGSGRSAASSSANSGFSVSGVGARRRWKVSWALVLVMLAMFVTGGLAGDVSRSRLHARHPTRVDGNTAMLLPQWSVALLANLPTNGLEFLA